LKHAETKVMDKASEDLKAAAMYLDEGKAYMAALANAERAGVSHAERNTSWNSAVVYAVDNLTSAAAGLKSAPNEANFRKLSKAIRNGRVIGAPAEKLDAGILSYQEQLEKLVNA